MFAYETCLHTLHLVIYVDYFEILFLIGSKGIFLIILRCFVKRYLSYFFSTKNLVYLDLYCISFESKEVPVDDWQGPPTSPWKRWGRMDSDIYFFLTLLWLGFSMDVKGLGGKSKILVKRATAPLFCMVIEDHM